MRLTRGVISSRAQTMKIICLLLKSLKLKSTPYSQVLTIPPSPDKSLCHSSRPSTPSNVRFSSKIWSKVATTGPTLSVQHQRWFPNFRDPQWATTSNEHKTGKYKKEIMPRTASKRGWKLKSLWISYLTVPLQIVDKCQPCSKKYWWHNRKTHKHSKSCFILNNSPIKKFRGRSLSLILNLNPNLVLRAGSPYAVAVNITRGLTK